MSDLVKRLVSGMSVDENDAKQDRIMLKLKRWKFQGEISQFDCFSTRLSNSFMIDGVQRRLFTTQQGDIQSATWPIVGGGGTRRYYAPPGTPLFSGKLRAYQHYSNAHRSEKIWQIIAELSLNPTRAMVYEKHVFDLNKASEDSRLSIPATLFASEMTENGRSIPFISGDNFEQGSRLRHNLFRQPNWDINFKRYWLGLISLLDEVLSMAASEADGLISVINEQKISLQTIETYWDLKENDPVATVAALEKPFRSLGNNSSIQWYTLPDRGKLSAISSGIVIGDHDNSPIIKIRVAKNTEIKIYAKTRSSIRFEVTHTKGAADIGAWTSDDLCQIYNWIEKTKLSSTNRMNEIISALGIKLSNSESFQYQPQRLLYDLYGALRNWKTALEILGILINTGKIEVRKSSPISPDIKKLVKNGIIKLVSPRNAEIRIFHLNERYDSALAAFQFIP